MPPYSTIYWSYGRQAYDPKKNSLMLLTITLYYIQCLMSV